MPTTGLALPFFSAGGSAILMSAISCGILINLSRSSRTEMIMRAAFRRKGAAYD
jgi:cell division protein FtsW